MSASVTPVKAIILDVFDTVLLRKSFPYENPYMQILTDLEITDPKSVAAQDYNDMLTKPISFAGYIDRHANADISTEQREIFLHNAQEVFAKEKGIYKTRPEWKIFQDEAASRNMKLCLGTNLSLPYTEIVNERFAQIPHKIYSCNIGARKPQAEFFQACCDMMNVQPHETVMIGNSFSSDMKGARNARLAHQFWIPLNKDITGKENERIATRITSLTDIFSHLPRL